MGSPRHQRWTRFSVVTGAVVLALALLSSVSSAQFPPIFATPTPAPATPSPTPTLTPPPATPAPTEPPLPTLPGTETPTPDPDEERSPKPTKDGDKKDDELDDELPPGLEEALDVPVFARTRPRNTVELVRILEPLTDLGASLDQVLVQGMGRFPVAGLAHYFDDWLNPRYTPKPHLHHGLDIFADFGTPVRAPDRGVVTRLTDGSSGGISVWMRGSDGTQYYFAHLLERAEGLAIGRRVEIGTVLGYVGDTGNARGGTPHLHFEIHPGGGGPVPPKPTVDAWLDEALDIAPKWVEAQRAAVKTKGVASAQPERAKDGIEASMLLTLLDPVGGSVGMLPSLEVQPRRQGLVSDRLLAALVRQRVQGRLFVPSSANHLYD